MCWRAAFQMRNECLICLSIASVASVYRPCVRYWSTCDAPSTTNAATAKPLIIMGLPYERDRQPGCQSFTLYRIFAVADRDLPTIANAGRKR